MSGSMPASHWTVAETFTHCPEIIPLFQHNGMACVGCAMAPFETLSEAADAYGLDVEELLCEFQRAMACRRRGDEGTGSGTSHGEQ
jgi:hybrid cluster-associated redox disulfide protein